MTGCLIWPERPKITQLRGGSLSLSSRVISRARDQRRFRNRARRLCPECARLLLSLLLLAAACCGRGAARGREGRVSVVGYLPEWRYEGANWEVISAHTTHLILFSLEISTQGHITALDRMPRPALLAEARAAADRHGTKLLICFGGNGRSRGFSAMSRSPSARRRFVRPAADASRRARARRGGLQLGIPGLRLSARLPARRTGPRGLQRAHASAQRDPRSDTHQDHHAIVLPRWKAGETACFGGARLGG